jgi:hypothetical protein
VLEGCQSSFRILSRTFLHLCEVLVHLSMWCVNGLYKAALLGIDAICQQLVSRIEMTVYLKRYVVSLTSKHISNQGWLI